MNPEEKETDGVTRIATFNGRNINGVDDDQRVDKRKQEHREKRRGQKRDPRQHRILLRITAPLGVLIVSFFGAHDGESHLLRKAVDVGGKNSNAVRAEHVLVGGHDAIASFNN